MTPKIYGTVLLLTLLLITSAATAVSGEEQKDWGGEKKPETASDIAGDEGKAVKEESEAVKTEAESKEENKYTEKDAADDQMKVDRIESTLKFGMHKDRITAITLISSIKSEEMKNRVLGKLNNIIENDLNTEVKKTAISAVATHNYKDAIPSLIKALENNLEEIQIAASYSLGRLNGIESKDTAIKILNKQDFSVNSNLTDALIILLTDLKVPDIKDLAVKTVKDPRSGKMARERFMIYLGVMGTPDLKDFLLELLLDEDEDMPIRGHAVKALGTLKINDSADKIKQLLKDIEEFPFRKKQSHYNLSMLAVAALVALGDSDSIDLLMNSLRSDNAAVRLNAVNLIKEFDDERTIDILKYKMKYDQNARVKRAAKKALEDKGLLEKEKTPDENGTVKDESYESDE